MDSTRFDSLAKLVGRWTTRRTALTLLAGLGLGAFDSAETEAKKKRKCKPACNECNQCKKGKCRKRNGRKKCKKGKCKPKAAGTRCTDPIGGTCQNGACTCSGGLTNCGGTCVNTQTDEENCGTCGTVCTATQNCNLGSCFPQSVCPSNQTSLCEPVALGVPCGTGCFCGRSTEGNQVCVDNEGFCGPLGIDNCTSSAACPTGEACVPVSACCGVPLPAGSRTCMAPCPAVDVTIQSVDAASNGRPGE